MKLLKQLGIILGLSFVGECAAKVLPVPGSVTGMVLLFLLLLFKALKPGQIEETGNFFLKNMAFFFIPAGVAILESFDILRANLVPFLLVCVISLVVTFAVTAFTVRGVILLQARLAAGKKNREKEGLDV